MVGMPRVAAVALLVDVLATVFAVAQELPQTRALPAPGAPESRIASGLREALTVGAENAVMRTGRIDGFFRNEAIKILMPDSLRRVETGLRAIGYGAKVDEFILALNRAGERAAGSAKPIFLEAIRTMTIEDAKGILNGGETGATEYFRRRTEDELAAEFGPLVQRATDEFGVTRQYKDLQQRLPFGNASTLDIDTYVVGKTLDGLFHVLGEEEKKIRKDPAARITAILRDVFGR
jgi:hypothetical protein